MMPSDTENSLSIIIPAYNEEEGLEESYNEAVQAAETLGITYQIIIVDDCSTDNTPMIAAKLSYNKHTDWIRNDRNLNLGGAYQVGLAKANCSHVTWVPGDANHPSADLVRVYRHLGSADVLIAMPDNPEIRTLFRRIISKSYTVLVNLITKNNIPYYNGLSVYKTDFVKSLEVVSTDFSFQAEILVKALFNNSSYRVCSTSLRKPDGKDSKALSFKNLVAIFNMLLLFLILRFKSS
jgi:glycosyltransferase involved in cell wall biosynthesis